MDEHDTEPMTTDPNESDAGKPDPDEAVDNEPESGAGYGNHAQQPPVPDNMA